MDARRQPQVGHLHPPGGGRVGMTEIYKLQDKHTEHILQR